MNMLQEKLSGYLLIQNPYFQLVLNKSEIEIRENKPGNKKEQRHKNKNLARYDNRKTGLLCFQLIKQSYNSNLLVIKI